MTAEMIDGIVLALGYFGIFLFFVFIVMVARGESAKDRQRRLDEFNDYDGDNLIIEPGKKPRLVSQEDLLDEIRNGR